MTVTEHAVTVSVENVALTTVRQGEQVRYAADGLAPAQAVDLGPVLAWRQDRLVVQDTPLRDVLDELERHRRGRIVITERRIGELPVTAVFDTRRTEDALQTIADALPVRVSRLTDLLVIVSPRD